MKKLTRALVIVALFLLVPYLIGNVTIRVLDAMDPPAHLRKPRLGVRDKTRLALGIIGVYYVALVSGWIILRIRKRKALPS